jgi:hypothetical protein
LVTIRDFEVPTFDESNTHLLPGTVHGFNLATKLWQAFFVEDLKQVKFDEGAWDALVLDKNVKVWFQSNLSHPLKSDDVP